MPLAVLPCRPGHLGVDREPHSSIHAGGAAGRGTGPPTKRAKLPPSSQRAGVQPAIGQAAGSAGRTPTPDGGAGLPAAPCSADSPETLAAGVSAAPFVAAAAPQQAVQLPPAEEAGDRFGKLLALQNVVLEGCGLDLGVSLAFQQAFLQGAKSDQHYTVVYNIIRQVPRGILAGCPAARPGCHPVDEDLDGAVC